MKYCSTPIKMALEKRLTVLSAGEDMEGTGTLMHCLCECKIRQLLGKQVSGFFND